MNQGIQVSFDLPLAWTEQSVVSVIPQQGKGRASVALSISVSGCLQNSLHKNMFVFGRPRYTYVQISHNLKAIFWKAKQKVQDVLRITWWSKHMSANKIIDLNSSGVIQITCTSTAINCVAINCVTINLAGGALHPYTAPCVNRALHWGMTLSQIHF